MLTLRSGLASTAAQTSNLRSNNLNSSCRLHPIHPSFCTVVMDPEPSSSSSISRHVYTPELTTKIALGWEWLLFCLWSGLINDSLDPSSVGITAVPPGRSSDHLVSFLREDASQQSSEGRGARLLRIGGRFVDLSDHG